MALIMEVGDTCFILLEEEHKYNTHKFTLVSLRRFVCDPDNGTILNNL